MDSWFTEQDVQPVFPVLDMKILPSDEKECRRLRTSLSKSGLFYLKNHGIEQTTLDEFVDITRVFFQADEQTKKKMVCNSLPLRGYGPLKSENLSKLLNLGDSPDLCMKYSWATTGNVAPSDDFRLIWQRVFSNMTEISKSLLSTIVGILGDQLQITLEDWSKTIGGDNMLRHLFYPKLREPQELAMAPHSDLGSITLLYQTPAANKRIALEAEYEGRYLPVPAVKGTIVVNFGDILEHISEKKIKATKHRVLHNTSDGSARTSTAFFCLPPRSFNLQKFKGSDFGGLLTDKIVTFGDLLDLDGVAYSKKTDSN